MRLAPARAGAIEDQPSPLIACEVPLIIQITSRDQCKLCPCSGFARWCRCLRVGTLSRSLRSSWLCKSAPPLIIVTTLCT